MADHGKPRERGGRRRVRGSVRLGSPVAVILVATTSLVPPLAWAVDRKPAAVAATSAEPDIEARRASAAEVTYFRDAGAALTPLLLHVKALPAVLRSVKSTGVVAPSQVSELRRMAEGFATARDLVGRLPVPVDAPAPVGQLMQVACQLYREAALTGADVQPSSGAPAARSTAEQAEALRLLGDRLIDQVRRLLLIDKASADSAPMQLNYPAPVPPVADITSVAVAEGSSGPTTTQAALSAAWTVLETAATGNSGGPQQTARALISVASVLQSAHGGQDEDAVTARIAILLAVLAQRAEAESRSERAAELEMLWIDVWSQAARLKGPHAHTLQALPVAALSRAAVWTGGAFNGSPPAMDPRQGVGSGLPGGLPRVNPSDISAG
jgi:hypothetical protein